MTATDLTRPVEQMLGHATAGRWDALRDVIAWDFEIVEPASLPYGGVHYGADGYVALMHKSARCSSSHSTPTACTPWTSAPSCSACV